MHTAPHGQPQFLKQPRLRTARSGICKLLRATAKDGSRGAGPRDPGSPLRLEMSKLWLVKIDRILRIAYTVDLELYVISEVSL